MARILVVEDSPTQASHIQLMLEDAGYEVEVSGNGVEALQVMARQLPDLVATDLDMPEMNGLQLVEAIRRDYSDVPVILMTAYGSEALAALALRTGAASYVPKSVLSEDLVPSVENIIAMTTANVLQHRALDCLTRTESEFILDNDPTLIVPVLAYLEHLLSRLKFCDATERMRIGVALREALLNAMDHGNLEVTSELRQDEEKLYHDLLARRRQQLPYRERRVHFTAKLAPSEANFVVRDEGPGFDPSNLSDPTDPSNLERVGGRGLLLIRTFMDEVEHNKSGNQVTMIKRSSW